MKTIDEAINGFFKHCKYEKNLSDKTIKAYKIDLRQFCAFIERGAFCSMINGIEKLVVRDFVQSISGFKPKTIKRKIAVLKVLFNYLEFEDEIAVNPFRKMKLNFREPKILPSVMNLHEVESVMKSAYKVLRTKKGGENVKIEGLRNIALFELLFAIGARVSELSFLRTENVDLVQGLIKLEGKGSKERLIQVCNLETLISLKQYDAIVSFTQSNRQYFFVNRLKTRLSDQSIRSIVKRHVSLAKLKRHVTPHTFRHTFATLLLEEGVDIKYIQQMLGHSSIATTQIYTHVSKEKQKIILSTLHPRRHFLLRK